MNERLNHCTNRILLLFAAMLLAGGVLSAQQSPYEEAVRSNPWLTGSNIAGLRTEPKVVRKNAVSQVRILGDYQWGKFRDSHMSHEQWSVGAGASTFVTRTKISLKGSLYFRHNELYEANGSMFLNPHYYPIDVMEFTPGRKSLQQYGFDGAIATDLGEHWMIGGMIKFASANYSKRKDIRHTNYRLDLDVAPSFIYHSGEWNIGASYIFNKNSESVKAERAGSSAQTYYAFLDEGLFYGVHEVWDGSGLHLTETGVDRLPVSEYKNGVGVQFQWNDVLYGEFEYRRVKGKIGEKGFDWYKYSGNDYRARFFYRINSIKFKHLLQASYSYLDKSVNRAVIDKVSSGGITLPKVFAYNEIARNKSISAALEYNLYRKKSYQFHADLLYNYERQNAFGAYPYIHTETFNTLEFNTSGMARLGIFEIDLNLGYRGRIGNWSVSDKLASTDLEHSPDRVRQEELYNIWRDYKSASVLKAELGLKFYILGYYKKDVYIGLSIREEHAFNPGTVPGKDRLRCMLELGYNF